MTFNTWELLALAFIAAMLGIAIAMLIAAWALGRAPRTDRRGTGHAPGPGNPLIDRCAAVRLTAQERRRFRN